MHSTTEHIGYQNIPVRIQSDIVSHDKLAVVVSETAKPLKLRPRTIKHHNRRAVRKQVGLRSTVDHEDLPARWVDINAIRTPRTFAVPFADKRPFRFEDLDTGWTFPHADDEELDILLQPA